MTDAERIAQIRSQVETHNTIGVWAGIGQREVPWLLEQLAARDGELCDDGPRT